MIVTESDCVSCDLPCIGSACKYFKVVRFICDECGKDAEELYHWDGEELCIDCILDQLEKVEYNETY